MLDISQTNESKQVQLSADRSPTSSTQSVQDTTMIHTESTKDVDDSSTPRKFELDVEMFEECAAALPSIEEKLDLVSTKPVSYVAEKILGSGGQAKVYLATEGLPKPGKEVTAAQPTIQIPEQKYAIKVYENYEEDHADKEISTLLKLRDDPHLIKMHGAYRGSAKVFVNRKIPKNEYDSLAQYRQGYEAQVERHILCLEVCHHGDLFGLVKEHGAIQDDSVLRYVFLQVCKGVKSLHLDAQLAHLDLKLENILIGNDGLVKLCDFGMVFPVEEHISKKLGTKFYCAPEIHSASTQSPYLGVTADIFSLGVILFILAFGAPPFNIAKNCDANFRILSRSPAKFWQHHPNVKNSQRNCNQEDLVDLLTSLLHPEVASRPQSIAQVMDHPFFSSEKDLQDPHTNSWCKMHIIQAKFASLLGSNEVLKED